MKIAIVGAGFAGLGTALYLLINSKGHISIDIFDPKPIGLSVSGLSAGLLHPFPGKRAEHVWNADRLLESTHKLITEASKGVGKSLVISKGVLRPAVTVPQIETFQKTVLEHPQETEWWDQKKAMSTIKGLEIQDPNGGALYIKNGLTLDVKGYLEGLWQMGLRFGLQYHQKEISPEKDLARFDKVILANGMGIKNFSPLAHLPLYPLKGQSLRLKWPENLPPLPCSLISEGYAVMDPDLKTCVIGATFERKFTDVNPDIQVAKPLIHEKIQTYFPALAKAEILECQAGIRAIYSKTSLPICGRVDDKYWFITGLGAKGLLFHGFMANALSHAIMNDNDQLIPTLLRY